MKTKSSTIVLRHKKNGKYFSGYYLPELVEVQLAQKFGKFNPLLNSEYVKDLNSEFRDEGSKLRLQQFEAVTLVTSTTYRIKAAK